MHYSYTSLAAPGGGVDHHNRCLGNRAWCVKVRSRLENHVTVSNNIFQIISGYLRHCVRDYDMAAYTVRGVCGLWAHLAAQLQQLQCLQYHQHGYIPSTCIPGICLPSTHNALRSGESSVLCRFYTLSNLLFPIPSKGAVPRGNATKEMIEQMGYREGQMFYKCPKCCSIKPDRAHHCSVCQRCIRKMDHHCPWVNNCVGENNQKYFVLFTVRK